jgi:NADH dehydrogenase/NADH:ubiquinone oxidoreductase subunit G
MKESFEKLEDNDYMIRSLKQEKEHAEKKMENLFSYLAGEDQYTDQLKFFGDKYKQRIEEFESLKIENEELKKQIADIRMSQDLRNLKLFDNEESNRVSMDRGRGESWSKFGTTS